MRYIKKLLIASVALLAVSPVFAADLTWGKYNLNLSVPDGGFEGINTATHYERQWEDMYLTIHVYTKDTKGDKKIYTTTLERKAEEYSMYEVQKTKVKVKNFDSYAVEGTMPDGSRCLLVNLVSKKSDYVYQVVINYLFGMREEVEDIVKSFSENPDRKPNAKKQKVQDPNAVDKKPSKAEQEEAKKREEERKYQEKRRKGEIRDI